MPAVDEIGEDGDGLPMEGIRGRAGCLDPGAECADVAERLRVAEAVTVPAVEGDCVLIRS